MPIDYTKDDNTQIIEMLLNPPKIAGAAGDEDFDFDDEDNNKEEDVDPFAETRVMFRTYTNKGDPDPLDYVISQVLTTFPEPQQGILVRMKNAEPQQVREVLINEKYIKETRRAMTEFYNGISEEARQAIKTAYEAEREKVPEWQKVKKGKVAAVAPMQPKQSSIQERTAAARQPSPPPVAPPPPPLVRAADQPPPPPPPLMAPPPPPPGEPPPPPPPPPPEEEQLPTAEEAEAAIAEAEDAAADAAVARWSPKAALEKNLEDLLDEAIKLRDLLLQEAPKQIAESIKEAAREGIQKTRAELETEAREIGEELKDILTNVVHEFMANPRGDHAEALRKAGSSINEACQNFIGKARECLQSNLMGSLSTVLNNLVTLATKVSTLVTGAPMLSALNRSRSEAKPAEAAEMERKERDDKPRH